MLEFHRHGDQRGYLVAIEGNRDIPFDIKRIFYIFGSDSSVVRGRHSNRKSEFVLINVCGSCRVRTVEMDGQVQEFLLNKAHTGIYLPKMVWKDMYEFSEDSILLCLSSEHYDNEEYIRDYDAFLKELHIHGN
jgi:dTDP-4-dehydrorhamnose 3,5-epimerase-like enzyme